MEEFICAVCGKPISFNREQEEKALADKETMFPSLPMEECSRVCTECFKILMIQSVRKTKQAWLN